MIDRELTPFAAKLRTSFQVIAVTGPRQSGKTTFARMAFPDLPYVNMESPLEQVEFRSDPIGFLSRFKEGAVIDEFQHVPELLSYLQVRVDSDRKMGRWALTGSQPMASSRSAGQSLAGRVAMLELLPFSLSELVSSPRRPRTLSEAVLRGGYPPLYDDSRDLEDPVVWLENYLTTFINRDVRSVLDIRNRTSFSLLVRHCAARVGQLLNKSDLAAEVGVDAVTIDAWLSVLEACYVIHLLRPHHRNFGKRLNKRPKLHFLDTGLACRLLHISDVNQLVTSPQWGGLVESWCFTEVLKHRLHRGLRPNLWFWLSSDQVEVDMLMELGTTLFPIEIKAGQTPRSSEAAGIAKLRELNQRDSNVKVAKGLVIYGGDDERPGADADFVSWREIDQALEQRCGTAG